MQARQSHGNIPLLPLIAIAFFSIALLSVALVFSPKKNRHNVGVDSTTQELDHFVEFEPSQIVDSQALKTHGNLVVAAPTPDFGDFPLLQQGLGREIDASAHPLPDRYFQPVAPDNVRDTAKLIEELRNAMQTTAEQFPEDTTRK